MIKGNGSRFRFRPFAVLLAVCCLPVPPATADQAEAQGLTDPGHQQEIAAWRAKRFESLKRPDGYLSQVGLEWLREGENRVGSAADNDIRLSGGPHHWGSVFLDGDELSFSNRAQDSVMVDGKHASETALTVDNWGKPTIVASGNLSFYAIFRGSYALRVKDTQTRERLDFLGVDNYPVDSSWRIEGRFIRAEPGTTMETVNVLGAVEDSAVLGTLEFDRNGERYSLVGLGNQESKDVWFIFGDRTNGHGTYGAGRFLHSEGLPRDGRLTVDFNKAYNPPCAFNEYSTCPLPPQRNRLDLWIEAGEKDYHPSAG